MYHLRFALIALWFIFVPVPGVALRLPPATNLQTFGLLHVFRCHTERNESALFEEREKVLHSLVPPLSVLSILPSTVGATCRRTGGPAASQTCVNAGKSTAIGRPIAISEFGRIPLQVQDPRGTIADPNRTLPIPNPGGAASGSIGEHRECD